MVRHRAARNYSRNRAMPCIWICTQATCIAHAASPGYETYKTGWHSLIVQQLPDR